MSFKLSTHRRLFFYTLLFSSLITIIIYFHRFSPDIINIPSDETSIPLCFQRPSIDHQQSSSQKCLPYERIISSIWTHDGTGLMKYIQWIITRKLGNIQISRLNDDCIITRENYFSTNPKTNSFVQIYIVSLTSQFDNQTKCSSDLVQIIKFGMRKKNQIYFKRKSLKATVAYQHLDVLRHNGSISFNLNSSVSATIEKANVVTERLADYLKTSSNAKSIIINSEDMIHANLSDCEKRLTDFIALLGFDTSIQIVKDVIQYDSHYFTQDATWWDQSETVEYILSMIPKPRPESFTYTNDFYHLHGNRSFPRYVSDSRQCFNDGIFPQMQPETITNRSSTDQPERCSRKQFDCAFSDIYSFSDREELYQPYAADTYFNHKPIKCAFAIPSILDKVRARYARNHTCETIVYTCISNCYDPLPRIQDTVPPGVCFVALLDTKTLNAYKNHYPGGKTRDTNIQWDFIDLGESGSLFRVRAKITEAMKIVGPRMFPMAKWFFWLDGKAWIINIKAVLTQAWSPIIGLHHSDFNRTSENEVDLTLTRVKLGEVEHSLRLNTSLAEIELQRAEYIRSGFYARSTIKHLPLFDIAIFSHRNNHPCTLRYLCGWHNEINYFSYRGQLSVYYSAERLNLSDYLFYIPRRFYHTLGHGAVC